MLNSLSHAASEALPSSGTGSRWSTPHWGIVGAPEALQPVAGLYSKVSVADGYWARSFLNLYHEIAYCSKSTYQREAGARKSPEQRFSEVGEPQNPGWQRSDTESGGLGLGKIVHLSHGSQPTTLKVSLFGAFHFSQVCGNETKPHTETS